MASPTDAVSSFTRGRKPNPPPTPKMFVEHLIAEGYDLADFGEEEWRGMAADLGMDDFETSNLLEDVAGWLE